MKFQITCCVGLVLCLSLSLPGAEQLKPLKFDSAAFIKASSTLLREREPELTPAEFAIYEQVVTMAQKQPTFALRLLENMSDKDDSSAAFDLVLGNLYFELQRYEVAEERFRRAISKHPDFRRAWENLGVLYYHTGKPAEAVPCLSKVVALGGWDPPLLGLLAWCLARSDNTAAAELAYLQAGILEPQNPDWIEGLLSILLETRQFARAEPLLRRLTRLKPREPQPWEMLAHVLVALQRPRDAIVTLEMAAGLNVIHGSGLEQLGDLYLEAGLTREAVRTYERLATEDAELSIDKILHVARALVDESNTVAAEKLLATLPPGLAGDQLLDYLQVRAKILSAQGDGKGALEALQALLAEDPLNGNALMQVATLQTEQGDEIQAGFTLESAMQIPEVAFRAHVQLAHLKVRRHDYAQALALLEKALKIQDSPLVREYRARVAALLDHHE